MSITLKRIAVIIFIAYLILTCYTAYVLISKNSTKTKKDVQRIWSMSGEDEWNPWGEELEQEDKHVEVLPVEKPKVKWWSNRTLDFGKNFQKGGATSSADYNVEVWGKAAIGLYLWEHIIGGKLERKMSGIWSYGFKKIENIKFKFRTGPGVIPSKVPATVQNVVLTLNGRSAEKIAFSRMWLDFLPQLPYLRSVAVVLLGDEQCNNDWILPYMSVNGGIINATFLIYDSALIDNENFFQWPLGVAMYRDFPRIDYQRLEVEQPRPYSCNFVGTIYPNSSREKMMQVIQHNKLAKHCLLKIRTEWLPNETKESMDAYVSALELSDLTLSPVGKNTECYRIYEALAVGSIPVVEDIMTPGQCGNAELYRGRVAGSDVPLRLLKQHDAPLVYVSNWEELVQIIEKESMISPKEKIRRRWEAIQWYERFKAKMRDLFVAALRRRLFGEKR